VQLGLVQLGKDYWGGFYMVVTIELCGNDDGKGSEFDIYDVTEL
jgi:hypothetical protein